MKRDEEGFLYPAINNEICIECGSCFNVCCLKNQNRFASDTQAVLGYKINDIAVRMDSSSGGAFTALCSVVLRQGGVVAGASFDESFNVVHRLSGSIKECEAFRGSKYVQSNLGQIYPEIGSCLKDGVSVLFTGTPCQCDGLRNYLYQKKIPQNNLIVCDMVCHGVPSPLVWNDYLDFIGLRNQMTGYRFRDKRFGWHGDNITVKYSDGKELTNTPKLKTFTSLYFSNYITRPVCENCIYTNYRRCSDITIADFWGIENSQPEFDDKKGVSMILVNTQKGREICDTISASGVLFDSTFDAVAQEQLVRPVRFSDNRKMFWSDYRSQGFEYIAQKYGHYDLYHRIKRRIINLLRKLR